MVQQDEAQHEGEHTDGGVEPHGESEGHASESEVGMSSASDGAKGNPGGQRGEEDAGDAVHSDAAPDDVPAHERYEEGGYEGGGRAEYVSDEQEDGDDSEQAE